MATSAKIIIEYKFFDLGFNKFKDEGIEKLMGAEWYSLFELNI